MEYNENGVFENRPSQVFLNRKKKLEPNTFNASNKKSFAIKTKAFSLKFKTEAKGNLFHTTKQEGFTSDSLSIKVLKSDGKSITWK